MSLIAHPDDAQGKLVPQLHDVAAWLAGARADVFREILSREPEVLLRSDVPPSAEDRHALCAALLRLYDQGALIDRDWTIHRHYRKLAHDRLAEQLRPYIFDGSRNPIVRRVAIDIAEACELRELEAELVDLVLDPGQPHQSRVNAAYAVLKIGGKESRARLKPLATDPAMVDPDDQLKGCALTAAWPAHMTAEEVFAVLTPPPELIGAYSGFLHSHLVQKLDPAGLPAALRWVETQAGEEGVPYDFERIIDAIMRKAWESLEHPGVEQAFIAALLALARGYKTCFGPDRSGRSSREIFGSAPDRRRRLLSAIIKMGAAVDRELEQVAFSGLATGSDSGWLLTELRGAATQDERRNWARVLWGTADRGNLNDLALIAAACETEPILAEVFVPIFGPIALHSAEAERMKVLHAFEQRRQAAGARDSGESAAMPPLAERLASALYQLDTGQVTAWWDLIVALNTTSGDPARANPFASSLAELPSWEMVGSPTQLRIRDAAERFLIEHEPRPEDRGGTASLHPMDLCGYLAFDLLWCAAPERLGGLSSAIWQRWAPVLLAYSNFGGERIGKFQPRLVGAAYQHAPDQVITALVRLLVRCGDEGIGIEHVLGKVSECWDDRIARTLFEVAHEAELKGQALRTIIIRLLDAGHADIEAFATSLLPSPAAEDETARSRSVAAAQALMMRARDPSWPALSRALKEDGEFADAVIGPLAWSHDRGESIGQGLGEAQLADFYVWLARRYPHAQDPNQLGVHSVTTRERIGRWRDIVLEQIIARGTTESVQAIRHISDELPHVESLRWRTLDAEAVTRHRTWEWPSSAEVLRLVSRPELRFVRTADQLLDVVCESLARLEDKLQRAEPPAAIDLWNEIDRSTARSITAEVLDTLRAQGKLTGEVARPEEFPGGEPASGSSRFRPKDEGRLSDYVKRHLDADLGGRRIVFNREVENRRGQLTDIRVDAFAEDSLGRSAEILSVIIEVKGDWHRDLETAMETQLVGRYLRETHVEHGLYLIGRFNCDRWDDTDSRKARLRRSVRLEAQEHFDGQAARLSLQAGKKVRAQVIDASLT